MQGRMDWVEANKKYPVDILVKDQETINQEYKLIEFVGNASEELKKIVKKTQSACAEFCRRVLLTYNRCHTSAANILEALLEHEMFLKHLQDRCNEDEQAIQQVKELDEKILKTEVAHGAVSIHLLEDQLRLIPARIAGIKTQATQHEITIRFLEPPGFENIEAEANVWRNFMNEQAGPS